MLGLLAYPGAAELANTAVLNGEDVASDISVVQLTSRPSQTPSSAATTAFSCSVPDAAGLFVLDANAACEVVLTSDQTAGGSASVVVTSLEGGLDASVLLTVWFPLDVSVQVGDSTLNSIAGSDACGQPLYQQTEATAVAVFGGAGLSSVGNVDITHLVSLETTTGAVTLSDGLLTASAVGVASVTITGATVSVSAASVTVSETTVTVVGLQSAVVTELVWSLSPPTKVAWSASTAGRRTRASASPLPTIGCRRRPARSIGSWSIPTQTRRWARTGATPASTLTRCGMARYIRARPSPLPSLTVLERRST